MPGLIDQLARTREDGDKCSCKELKILLARAERSSCATDYDAALFEIFKVATRGNPPVAPVTYALDTGVPPPGWCLRADPVYLRPDTDRVLMIGNEFLNLTQNEAIALAGELGSLFDAVGATLEAVTPRRWYVHLPGDPEVSWHSLSQVRGMDIHHYLPRDAPGKTSARLWRHLFNEAQMVLNDSSVNKRREERGELPVNSLWFWGAGISPAFPQQEFAQVWSNDPLTLGLAKLVATPRCPAPDSATSWLLQAITPGRHLVVPKTASTLASNDGLANDPVTDTLTALNQRWFAPLMAALNAHELAGLDLYADKGVLFRITSKAARRWWKRPRSLASHVPHAPDSP